MALRTEAGRRETNEDSILSMRLGSGALVVAVADGMGGLERGDVASRTALEALRGAMTRGLTLMAAVEEANRAVHERAGGQAIGTTLVAAHAEGRRVTVANVGDSRAYRCTPLGIRRISVDHTHAEDARRAGDEAAASAMGVRWASALTRSLGAASEVEVDLFGPFDVDDGESLLLCSDGVHGALSDLRIESWSQSLQDPDAAVERLLGAALDAGSEDNLSAVLLHRPASREGRPAALARRGPAWDPRTLMERSPAHLKNRGHGRRMTFGLLGVAAAAMAVVAWLMMR